MHNLLMQFFTPDSSKIEVFETCFFDIVTTYIDHPSHVKHFLGRLYVVFSLLLGVDSLRGGLAEGNRIFCFFSILSRKSVSGVPTPWGLYGAEWDERLCSLCTFQPFLLCWRFWRPR